MTASNNTNNPALPIYLDYAATTPVSAAVLKAMMPYFSEQFYNPSALYTGARDAKSTLESARARAAKAIGARPSEIAFTAGSTESTNLAIKGVMQRYPKGHMVVSAVEHDAVMRPALAQKHTVCSVDARGVVDVQSIQQAIKDDTVLVSVIYASNEVGTVQPLKDVAAHMLEVKARRKSKGNDVPLYLHTDASQAPLYLDCNVARLGVDMMTLNGSKIYGPKQSGILYLRAGTVVAPQILGGGQEFGLRSGTENVAYAIGLSHALDQAQSHRHEANRVVAELAHWFREELADKHGAVLNGHPKRRLPHNVHVTFPGCDAERVLFALDDVGIYAASGSACSASSDEPSHVLRAMGISDADAHSSLRFTIGELTTKEQLMYVLGVLGPALRA